MKAIWIIIQSDGKPVTHSTGEVVAYVKKNHAVYKAWYLGLTGYKIYKVIID